MTLKLYNSLHNQVEVFTPIKEGKASLYSCGPTVYDFAHIGNFRSFLSSDVLARALKLYGYNVTKVTNITDVGHLVSDADEGEDKMLKAARLQKKDPYAIAQFYEEAYVEDEKFLRILPPTHRPRATEYIQEQIDMAQEILDKGMAYEVNGSVYFRTKKFKTYGQLSGNNLENLIAGARVEVNSEKEDPLDFALWKKAEPNHLMQWQSPWGMGFPGWHIECSAMSKALLGDHFDIHTGGEDNIFPHHECEIAQNEACCGKKSVNYWVHTKHLMVDGKKMSKSLGNFFTIKDLREKGYDGATIRLALISSHYRNSMNFTLEGLDESKKNIERFEEARRIFGEKANGATPSEFAHKYHTDFKAAIGNDLNTAEALAIAFDIVKDGMIARDNGLLRPEDAASIMVFLEQDFNSIFDIFTEQKEIESDLQNFVEEMIIKRKEAKAEKNYALADEIRDELFAKGIELIDSAEGTTWKQI